jgi:hypothetical protein
VANRSHVYEFKIGGVASDLVRAEFEDVEVRVGPGSTRLRTGLVDQAALFGLIRRIEDLGLVLLEVEAIDTSAEPGESKERSSWST